MPSSSSSRAPRYERGVYKAAYRIDGNEVLFAIKSNGDRLKKIIVLRTGVSEERAIRWFEELLDRVDPPRPQLQLVKDAPAPRTITLEQLDALYRDADPVSRLLWHRKRARMIRESGRVLPPSRIR